MCAYATDILPYQWSLLYPTSQDDGNDGEMSDWDHYTAEQYELLLAEAAYEQENK